MSTEEIKVFVVHASDEGCSDNSGFGGEGYTISKDHTVAGWETDNGHSSYGLKKEDAEYYAKCINEYPRLLSLIDQYKIEKREMVHLMISSGIVSTEDYLNEVIGENSSFGRSIIDSVVLKLQTENQRYRTALEQAKEALDNEYNRDGGIIKNNKAYTAIFNALAKGM